MNMFIRKYHPSDFAELYNICLITSNNGNDIEPFKDEPYLLGNIFVGPYIVYEPELCFVVTANNKPVGYILGTENSNLFYEKCEKDWFPLLRKRYKLPDENDTSRKSAVIKYLHRGHKPKVQYEDYPAHLHIDILPEAQGKGMGKLLMNEFVNELKKRKITGVHLEVGKSNSNAIDFYKHLGFTVLKEYRFSVLMGKIIL